MSVFFYDDKENLKLIFVKILSYLEASNIKELP